MYEMYESYVLPLWHFSFSIIAAILHSPWLTFLLWTAACCGQKQHYESSESEPKHMSYSQMSTSQKFIKLCKTMEAAESDHNSYFIISKNSITMRDAFHIHVVMWPKNIDYICCRVVFLWSIRTSILLSVFSSQGPQLPRLQLAWSVSCGRMWEKLSVCVRCHSSAREYDFLSLMLHDTEGNACSEVYKKKKNEASFHVLSSFRTSLQLCAKLGSSQTRLLEVCQLGALRCMGRTFTLAGDSECDWPDKTSTSCEDCHPGTICQGECDHHVSCCVPQSQEASGMIGDSLILLLRIGGKMRVSEHVRMPWRLCTPVRQLGCWQRCQDDERMRGWGQKVRRGAGQRDQYWGLPRVKMAVFYWTVSQCT